MQPKAQLRRLPFFECHEISTRASEEVSSVLKDIKITCMASGRGLILIGGSCGTICGFNKGMKDFEIKFSAFSLCVDYLFMSKSVSIVSSIGRDHAESCHILRVWDQSRIDNRKILFCCKEHRLSVFEELGSLVSCATVSENFTLTAVGFDTGSLLLLRGDPMRQRALKETCIKYFKIPITGLCIIRSNQGYTLFVTTMELIGVLDLKNNKEDFVSIINDSGCNLRCSAVFNSSSGDELLVATDEGIKGFYPEGHSQFISLEGKKRFIRTFNSHLIYCMQSIRASGKLPHSTSLSSSSSSSVTETLCVLTLDHKMRYISFSKPIPDVFDVVYEWGCLVVFTTNGKIYEISECSIESKLDILFKKNLFDLAISLARQSSGSSLLHSILRKYGDHLYSKGDMEEAMSQYIQSIETLEPSHVIRKFLEPQNIHLLTVFLENMHLKRLANSNHTTLLLNCYIRMGNVSKLDEFLSHDASEWNFDVDAAIKVCHQARLYDRACHLADKSQNHSWFLKIKLEGSKDYKGAMEYLSKLTFSEAEVVLKNYGRLLLLESADKLVLLLKKMCTFSQDNPSPCSPESFIHIFNHHRSHLQDFLEYIVELDSNCSRQVYNTLIELYTYGIGSSLNEDEIRTYQNKCLKILEFEEGNYDADHALMLCQLNSFTKGVVKLYEKYKKHSLILKYHMDEHEYKAIIRDCELYGNADPSLWLKSLSFFAQNFNTCESHLAQLISHIDNRDALPLLSVVQPLGKLGSIPLSIIKEYVGKKLRRAMSMTQTYNKQIAEYKAEICEIQKNIDKLKEGQTVINSSTCFHCMKELELPVSHILCGHSYHQHCLDMNDEGENCCPRCFQRLLFLAETENAQPIPPISLLQFEKELLNESDPVMTAAKYFQYGLFSDKATSARPS